MDSFPTDLFNEQGTEFVAAWSAIRGAWSDDLERQLTARRVDLVCFRHLTAGCWLRLAKDLALGVYVAMDGAHEAGLGRKIVCQCRMPHTPKGTLATPPLAFTPRHAGAIVERFAADPLLVWQGAPQRVEAAIKRDLGPLFAGVRSEQSWAVETKVCLSDVDVFSAAIRLLGATYKLLATVNVAALAQCVFSDATAENRTTPDAKENASFDGGTPDRELQRLRRDLLELSAIVQANPERDPLAGAGRLADGIGDLATAAGLPAPIVIEPIDNPDRVDLVGTVRLAGPRGDDLTEFALMPQRQDPALAPAVLRYVSLWLSRIDAQGMSPTADGSFRTKLSPPPQSGPPRSESDFLSARVSVLHELLSGADSVRVPSCDDWSERFGEPAPTTLDGWHTLAVRCGVDPNVLLAGALTLRGLVAIAEGYFLNRADAKAGTSTPTKRTRRRRPRNNDEAKARRAERDRKAKADRKLWDAWQTGQYRTYADLAKTQDGMSATDVCRVIKRVGKRISRHGFA